MRINLFAIALLAFMFCPAVSGQNPVGNVPAADRNTPKTPVFFPLDDLRPGMKGTARTVFRGSVSEEFGVEILGVLPDAIGPRQDLIVGRISGGEAERTRVFAGMSGSPVYINGRLVGAISYSFPFSKEAICGITPIEQMVSIFERSEEHRPEAGQGRKFSFAELAATEWTPDLAGRAGSSGSVLPVSGADPALEALAGQSFRPIATPLTYTGLSGRTLEMFSNDLLRAGLLPVSAAGGSARITPLKAADETTLVGGDSVSMQLARGDISLAASGTVTFRDGEQVYAFGHPFLSLGSADLPMSESSVVIVVPSVNNSFKLAVAGAMVGSMTQDRATGVYGRLGRAPKMIPVKIDLRTSRNRTETLEFEVINDRALTPLLVNLAIVNAITAQERGIGDMTVEITGRIDVVDEKPVVIGGRHAGPAASRQAAISVVVPVANLVSSSFEDLEISGISLEVSSTDGSRTAKLDRVELDRSEVRAGEEISIRAFIRTDTGLMLTQRIPFRIPADTPAGTLKIDIGDGNALQARSPAKYFVPANPAELIARINEVKRNDRLYVQSYRVTKGAVIGSNELPNLPPSVLATLNSNKTVGGFKPTVETIHAVAEVAPAEYIITGQQSLEIEVVK